MNYYILYPKKSGKKVKIITTRPNIAAIIKSYAFAEGPFHSKKKIIFRLNRQKISAEERPKEFRN